MQQIIGFIRNHNGWQNDEIFTVICISLLLLLHIWKHRVSTQNRGIFRVLMAKHSVTNPDVSTELKRQFSQAFGQSIRSKSQRGHSNINEKQKATVSYAYLLVGIYREQCQGLNQVKLKLRDLALAIYRTIVFPSTTRVINDNMIIFYDRMGKKVFNPAPAILVETIYSLNYNRRVERAYLTCHTQMLHV